MRIKNLLALMLTLAVCFSLAACGGSEDNSNEAKYTVSVVDSTGNPMTSGVIVRILQDGQQVEMQVADAQGKVEQTLTKGDYTVELKFTDSNAQYYYDTANTVLSADKTQLEVTVLNMAAEEHSLYAPTISGESAETVAYTVTLGGTYITPQVDARNYYLFTPAQSGTYAFSLSQGEGTVGYYGAPHFVQSQTATENIDGVVSVSVSPGMIGENGATATLVIGVDAKSETAVLSVVRSGDHKRTIEEEPWTEYVTSHTPTAFTFTPTEGKTLTYVDIYNGTAADYPVVLGGDGFYHMGAEDGPLVYINLGKEAPNASFYLMINGDGLGGGAPVRRYFYNDDGTFVKKEDYTQILLDYMACMDEKTGLYPLTADLAYIIESRAGWWTADHADYIFDGCNSEIGWLFACCFEK